MPESRTRLSINYSVSVYDPDNGHLLPELPVNHFHALEEILRSLIGIHTLLALTDQDKLDRIGPTDLANALQYIGQTCDALANEGFVHLDQVKQAYDDLAARAANELQSTH